MNQEATERLSIPGSLTRRRHASPGSNTKKRGVGGWRGKEVRGERSDGGKQEEERKLSEKINEGRAWGNERRNKAVESNHRGETERIDAECEMCSGSAAHHSAVMSHAAARGKRSYSLNDTSKQDERPRV
ncbi:hypothetical protein EYF80_066175 [Liparis tanakae]|uniref:Uncharacterized protein n=1 Tax=Liparis tanakae TaxID=230148 RepID=A0A4Z2E4U2_9TELE|nr:hypothetical protein EYF80_066175 [Liparis tanakae]